MSNEPLTESDLASRPASELAAPQKRVAELEQQVTLEAALADSNILTVNILRLWDAEKIKRFALHLLGSSWQEMAAENERLTKELADTEAIYEMAAEERGYLEAEVAALRQRLDQMTAENERASRNYAILQQAFADLNEANAKDIQECHRLRAAMQRVGEKANAIAKARITIAERIVAITGDMPVFKVSAVWGAFREEGEMLESLIAEAGGGAEENR